jgi:hypothetical protein
MRDAIEIDRANDLWDLESLRKWMSISWAISPSEYLQNPEDFEGLVRLNAIHSIQRGTSQHDATAVGLLTRVAAIAGQLRRLLLRLPHVFQFWLHRRGSRGI